MTDPKALRIHLEQIAARIRRQDKAEAQQEIERAAALRREHADYAHLGGFDFPVDPDR